MNSPLQPAGRLAPSPTGGLHLGHARTFLLAWLLARGAGGRVVLRTEDLDRSRVRPGMAELAVADLRWLGLDWDEGPDIGGPQAPYTQSERLDLYHSALSRLRDLELVYPCTCTRADIARASSAPHASDEGPTYPGTCAHRSASDASSLSGRPFAWRFRVPNHPISWPDLVLGPQSFPHGPPGGDFIVARSDGSFAYQLAVVVDDSSMQITQVLRGDDLVPSTPRQLLLYDSLGLAPPGFAHVPLAIDPSGLRLSKRDQSLDLSTLRSSGLSPRSLLRLITSSCGLPPSEAPFDALRSFDLSLLPVSPWVVDSDDLVHRPPGG